MPNWTKTTSDSKMDKHLYEIAKALKKVATAAAYPSPSTTTTATP